MTPQRKRLLIVSAIFVVLLIVAYFMFWSTPDVQEKPAAGAQPKRLGSDKAASSQQLSSDAVVYISGGVVKPGVYRINGGSRVVDVVSAAGGLTVGANPNGVNMAMSVVDGMHIIVPMKFAQDDNVSPSVNPNGTAAMQYNPDATLNNVGKVSINSADKTQLAALPGIGDALAQRVIDYRSKNGRFTALADIKKVSGIGDARYNKIKDLISL